MSYILSVYRWLKVICNEIVIRLVKKYCEYIVADNCCSRLIIRRVVINEISTQSTYLVILVKWLLCRLSVAPWDRTSFMAIADWFSRIIKGLQSFPPPWFLSSTVPSVPSLWFSLPPHLRLLSRTYSLHRIRSVFLEARQQLVVSFSFQNESYWGYPPP